MGSYSNTVLVTFRLFTKKFSWVEQYLIPRKLLTKDHLDALTSLHQRKFHLSVHKKSKLYPKKITIFEDTQDKLGVLTKAEYNFIFEFLRTKKWIGYLQDGHLLYHLSGERMPLMLEECFLSVRISS